MSGDTEDGSMEKTLLVPPRPWGPFSLGFPSPSGRVCPGVDAAISPGGAWSYTAPWSPHPITGWGGASRRDKHGMQFAPTSSLPAGSGSPALLNTPSPTFSIMLPSLTDFSWEILLVNAWHTMCHVRLSLCGSRAHRGAPLPPYSSSTSSSALVPAPGPPALEVLLPGHRLWSQTEPPSPRPPPPPLQAMMWERKSAAYFRASEPGGCNGTAGGSPGRCQD